MAKPKFFGVYLGLAKNDNFVKFMDVFFYFYFVANSTSKCTTGPLSFMVGPPWGIW
jgi:hypothetical protein